MTTTVVRETTPGEPPAAHRAALGVPASSMKSEIVDGVRIAYADEGAGPPVVCLHAIGHGGRDYEGLARELRVDHRVIRVDWPRHGRSGADRTKPSGGRYARLLVGLLDRLELEAPIVIGNSIGGAAALAYAAQRPVRALVLCNPGGLLEINTLVRTACRVMAALFARGARGAAWFPRVYAAYYRRLVLPSPAAGAQRERVIAAAYDSAPELWAAWQSFGEPSADLRALAASLDVPIWLAWARRDRLISYRAARPAIEALRHARVTMFDAGHSAFLEQPAAFLAAFRAFEAELAG